GGSPSLISAVFFEEGERGLMPLCRIGWLHIQVIVNRHRWMARAGFNASQEDRVAGSFDQLSRRADRFQVLPGKLARAPAVAGVSGVHADAGYFNQFGKLVLKVLASRANM